MLIVDISNETRLFYSQKFEFNLVSFIPFHSCKSALQDESVLQETKKV